MRFSVPGNHAVPVARALPSSLKDPEKNLNKINHLNIMLSYDDEDVGRVGCLQLDRLDRRRLPLHLFHSPPRRATASIRI